MKPSVALICLPALAWCSAAGAATAVDVEGVFLAAATSTEITQVQVGQNVRLAVRVRDASDSPQGVVGGMVDVTWDSSVLELVSAIDASEQTIGDVSAVFDPRWTGFFSGAKTAAGEVVDLGAGQTPPFDQYGGAQVPFFTLTFRALAVGQANVTLNGHGFGLIGKAATADDVDAPGLTVVDAGEPPEQPIPGTACFGPGMAAAFLMAAGWGGMTRRRRGATGR